MSLRSVIKSWFQTGDVPTQTQYSDTWDSTVIWDDDVETTLGTTDSKVPTSKAVSDAISGIGTPTLQDVTTAGSTTTDAIQVENTGATATQYGDAGIQFLDIANSRQQNLNFDNPLTNNETIIIPNKSGTMALLSDIPPVSGYVPYTGATGDVDLGTYALNAKSVKVNGTGGSGHLSLKHQSSGATAAASESAIYADNSGNPQWKNDSLAVDALFTSRLFGAIVDAFTSKSTPVDADEFGIADSAASNGSKKVTLLNLWTNYIKTKADAVYQAALGFTPLNQSQSAYTFWANNTNATANATAITFKAIPKQTYTGTIVWTGTTAPGGTTQHSYSWQQVGNVVTFTLCLIYGTQGSSLTQVLMSLPSDMPSPVKPDGITATSDVVCMLVGQLNAANSISAAQHRASLRIDTSSTSAFQLALNAPSAGNHKSAWISGTYLTA